MFRYSSSKFCSLAAAALLCHAAASMAAAQQADFKVQIVADDMCCQGCAQKIAGQLYAAPGVRSVQADLPTRVLTVTGKAAPNLTLQRLWQAVEQGEGGPSKLVIAGTTYSLTRADKLAAEERLPQGRYAIVVRDMHSQDCAQKIANKLYPLPGVKGVRADVAGRTVYVDAPAAQPLSPWTLAAAVEQGEDLPLAISGPHGRMAIERAN